MKGSTFIFATLLAATIPGQSHAESFHPYLDQKHSFSVGGFRQNAEAEIYADADQLDRVTLDLDDLGMDDRDTSFTAQYRYRLAENWMLSAGAFKFKTTGNRSTSRDFTYDGVEFEAGTDIDTELEVNTYIVDVLYKVYGSDRAEVLVGGGLHVFDFSTQIEARAFIGEAERSGKSAEEDLLAPLPNLRLRGFYALTPKWALSATMGWLSLEYDDYGGDFFYIHARTGYRFTQRFEVSVGYQFVDVKFSSDRERGEVGADVQFDGPSLQLTYGF